MPSNLINSFIKKSGKSKIEVEKAYSKAKKEAEAMGQKDNHAYITEIWKTILGIKESVYKDLANAFLKSEKDFNSFYEETMVSGDIPKDVRPDTLPKKKKKKEDEDENGTPKS